MDELRKLTETVNALIVRVNEIAEEIAKDKIMIYDYIDENMPEWAREAVRAAVNKGALLGDEEGRLGLTYYDLRAIVREYRMGMYK